MNCNQGTCGTTSNGTNLFEGLDQQLNHLVRQFFPESQGTARILPTTVHELATHYLVQCDVPGCTSEEIDVQVDEGVLSITVKPRVQEIGEGVKVLHDERNRGGAQRRFRLPKDADATGIDAELKSGILSLTVRKVAAVVPKKIEIRS